MGFWSSQSPTHCGVSYHLQYLPSNWSHSSLQNMPPESTVLLTTRLSRPTVLLVHSKTRTCPSDGTDMLTDTEMNSWLLQAVHGVLLFVRIVLKNALPVFANVDEDSRNGPKRQRNCDNNLPSHTRWSIKEAAAHVEGDRRTYQSTN